MSDPHVGDLAGGRARPWSVASADVGLLGELRVPWTALDGSAGWDLADWTWFSRGADYYLPMTVGDLCDDANARLAEVAALGCEPGVCRAAARYRAADYLLNRAARIAYTLGEVQPVLHRVLTFAAALVRTAVARHPVAAAPPTARLRLPLRPDAPDEVRTVVEGDNHFMTLAFADRLREPADFVTGPLLGAAGVVPLTAGVLRASWAYSRFSAYGPAGRRGCRVPAVPPGVRHVLVVDDNVGTGRTLGRLLRTLQRPGLTVRVAAVEQHYEKFVRDPAGSLHLLRRNVPDGLAGSSAWQYRHYQVTGAAVHDYVQGRRETLTVADWGRRSAGVIALAGRDPAVPVTGREDDEADATQVPLPVRWSRCCPGGRTGWERT